MRRTVDRTPADSDSSAWCRRQRRTSSEHNVGVDVNRTERLKRTDLITWPCLTLLVVSVSVETVSCSSSLHHCCVHSQGRCQTPVLPAAASGTSPRWRGIPWILSAWEACSSCPGSRSSGAARAAGRRRAAEPWTPGRRPAWPGPRPGQRCRTSSQSGGLERESLGGRGGRSNFVRLLCVDQLQKVSSEFLEWMKRRVSLRDFTVSRLRVFFFFFYWAQVRSSSSFFHFHSSTFTVCLLCLLL